MKNVCQIPPVIKILKTILDSRSWTLIPAISQSISVISQNAIITMSQIMTKRPFQPEGRSFDTNLYFWGSNFGSGLNDTPTGLNFDKL